jgi:hypothetical protein
MEIGLEFAMNEKEPNFVLKIGFYSFYVGRIGILGCLWLWT